jgi:hypothetical protein
MYAKNAIEMGLDISYETVRSWVLKFGPVIARQLPNLACAASTYSYSPDRSRGLIPTLALPNLRQGYRKEGRDSESSAIPANSVAQILSCSTTSGAIAVFSKS